MFFNILFMISRPFIGRFWCKKAFGNFISCRLHDWNLIWNFKNFTRNFGSEVEFWEVEKSGIFDHIFLNNFLMLSILLGQVQWNPSILNPLIYKTFRRSLYFSIQNYPFNRVGRSVDSERFKSGMEELGLLMEFLNFQVEIPSAQIHP
jgi:hypothetical protein